MSKIIWKIIIPPLHYLALAGSMSRKLFVILFLFLGKLDAAGPFPLSPACQAAFVLNFFGISCNKLPESII